MMLTAACIQLWKHVCGLIFAIDGSLGAVHRLPDLGGVACGRLIIQALQALVEVICLCVAPALVDQRDVAVALDARQRHAALVGHHLLSRPRVDAAGDMTQRTRIAPQSSEDAVLLTGEPGLERTVNVLTSSEGLSRA